MRATLLLALIALSATRADDVDQQMLAKLKTQCDQKVEWSCMQEKALRSLVEEDEKPVTEYLSGYQVKKVETEHRANRSLDDPGQYLIDRTWDYLQSHELVVSFNDPENGAPRTASANTFLTGFGLGFLAFGLKKLLLPFFIGAQVIKSILLAIFLPTLLTGIGKFLGKSGASIFSASAGHGHSGGEDEFDFKDNFDPNYESSGSSNVASFTSYPQKRRDSLLTAGAGYGGFPTGAGGLGGLGGLSGLYGKRPIAAWPYKRPVIPDYKTFARVPDASLIMSGFDPYYSPIVSRLDVIFKQMGYEKKGDECKKRLICNMYQQPAKYAPYSNLVSAQLSRDLSELQKPTQNNKDSLRFFALMKAAKDGQEGSHCAIAYPDCDSEDSTDEILHHLDGAKADQSTLFGSASPPMVKTYHEINKLVQARRLAKQIAQAAEEEKQQKSAPASA
ncbi:uncharacterized protein LOC132192966 isoform X2 [Neocloeon triangulifer]|uniref:uncharacterized protein LOC132192966 isoform X2 n=1 Tax=Neocloeon triangulifer TaxID=2078957 RepID=UPI00286EC369|nr:uncharacterized protein LOC132192966 isoform X2 [Neocloeon triangulifer]